MYTRTDYLRKYGNTIEVNFKERGENFTLDVPHIWAWNGIISFLKKRGFKVSENKDFKKEYKVLSPYHKIAVKKDIRCLLNIGCSDISIEFGNYKNLWDGASNHFWSNPRDERYTKLTYLEEVAVKHEIYKLIDFCRVKFNMLSKKEREEMSPEEFILNDNKINHHIHGTVTCIDDIRLSIKEDSYNYRHNSTDKNGKKIISGDVKYFYDYHTKRLSRGIAIHNINSMWWIVINGELKNLCSSELFDFSNILPRRKQANREEMERIIRRFEKEKDYLRCHKLTEIFKKNNTQK